VEGATLRDAGQTRLAQQTGDAPSAHADALVSELGIDAWGAVDAVGLLMDLLDASRKSGVGE